ncbi:CRISPR-associated helicase Cas3' [Bifidobacterium psychraerophilum]|jgi:CRISPR-associated endonuclease/helicase Cas3|uniref:CRISPR-associated helicase Cas3' n=1 Tax=Bifidobacterium psychraerophilum TaxID=218140 RepID=UPI0030B8299C
MSQLYARKNAAGAVQTLIDHLRNTARIAGEFEDEFSETSKTAGIHHDEGKAKKDFQEYLFDDGIKRGTVIHAYQGAFTISEIPTSSAIGKLTQEILELVITSHHGDLPDCIVPTGDSSFFEKMSETNKSKEKYHYQEVKENLYGLDLDTRRRFDKSAEETDALMHRLNHAGYVNERSLYFSLGQYVKYIFSRLVDADRLDAGYFGSQQRFVPCKPDWRHLIDRFEKSIGDFDNTTFINQLRFEISEACRQASVRATGIYTLAVPTGGGKTLASLRFALHHALRTKKQRVIYVSPYLTITSQTTKSFRDILGLSEDSDVILEHYSGVMGSTGRDGDNDDIDHQGENDGSTVSRRKLAAERWDSPIIVTTMVQFLETVMSSHATKLRKFHNMANSVIIFDEIQSIPVNAINLFKEVVSFLSAILNCTILLCSATVPQLETIGRRNLLLSENPDIIEDSDRYAAAFKRTNIVPIKQEFDLDEFANFVLEKALENGNCLAIVNLRSEARRLYQCLEQINADNQFTVVHLSTSMCGMHRAKELGNVIETLKAKKPVICVSTQLIEAGVDISFACVIRATAGLDSILQSAGRCNRNGESHEPKNVYVVSIKNERGLEILGDIKRGKEITNQLIQDYAESDLSSDDMLHEFYESYFASPLMQKKMDYQVNDTGSSVYDMLSLNNDGRKRFENRTSVKYGYHLAQAFKTASDRFQVIPHLAQDVIVDYQDSLALLDKFKEEKSNNNLVTAVKILHRLQGYSVSLFDYEVTKLSNSSAISIVDQEFGISLLDKQHYSQQYGVVLDPEMSGIFDDE